MAKLSKIEGIEDAFTLKLKAAGVTTVEKLLSMGATAAGRKDIAKQSKISEKLITKWVTHADFFRIKGIAGQKAELLTAVGINDVKDLSKYKAEQLHMDMLALNEKKNIIRRVPGLVQIKRWVDTAKKMPPVIKK